MFFMLYVDDILLVSNNLVLLHETKFFFSKNFEMKDMGVMYHWCLELRFVEIDLNVSLVYLKIPT